MCLLVPGQIASIQGDTAVVDYGSEKRKGKLLEQKYVEGDYVLIQGGIVVSKVEENEAKQALQAYHQALEEE